MSIPNDLIPKDRLALIRSMNAWDDGDIWPVGDGKFVEYEGRRRRFIVRKGDDVLASYPAKRFLNGR
jgi:hypothetical protein